MSDQWSSEMSIKEIDLFQTGLAYWIECDCTASQKKNNTFFQNGVLSKSDTRHDLNALKTKLAEPVGDKIAP